MPDAPPDMPFTLTAEQAAQLRVFKVYVTGRKQPRKVTALYHKIEDGALVFRIFNPGGGYPFMVATFAHGMWREVR